MSVRVEVLFDRPQQEIASLILDRLSRAVKSSIITGFATPGGLAAIGAPLIARPATVEAVVIGAGTYPAFQVLDDLVRAGVPATKLHVHLGHTVRSSGRKHPFVRFHPMLHSKIYYSELPNGEACAFVGSHNVTSFALTGLNGEAAVLIEGRVKEPEFDAIRRHIAEAVRQSAAYVSAPKEAFASWTREYLDGLQAEMRIPTDSHVVRTILIFAMRDPSHPLPVAGEQLYFELPDGIAVKTLETETHLFVFDTLPQDPLQALQNINLARATYKCETLGADNKQGNREVDANWWIDDPMVPVLQQVPGGSLRPAPAADVQQVRAEVLQDQLEPFDYLFDTENRGWTPTLSDDEVLSLERLPSTEQFDDPITMAEALPVTGVQRGWHLVKALTPRDQVREADADALRLAAPESGSYVLVSLRRRKKSSG